MELQSVITSGEKDVPSFDFSALGGTAEARLRRLHTEARASTIDLTTLVSAERPQSRTPKYTLKSASKKVAFQKPSLVTADGVVTFIVDKSIKQKTFLVHKSYAKAYSPFFQKAFSGPFTEGRTQTMKLEDVEAEIFGHLVHWLYYQEMESITCIPSFAERTMCGGKLWTLAGRFLLPKLQNAAMEALTLRMARFDKYTVSFFGVEFATYAYSSDSVELKMLAVDWVAGFANPLDPRDYYDSLPSEMIIDLVIAMKESSKRQTSVMDSSKYTDKED